MSIEKKFYVIGDPIEHSKSPVIHTEFAAQFGLSINYQKARVSECELADFISKLETEEIAGINLTVPLKERAFRLASKSTERAVFAKAVNTLWLSHGKIFADNTDGWGIVRDLERNMGLSLKGKKVLIVGAGGSARGILGPILSRMPESVAITNRTREKSICLAKIASTNNIKILGWGEKSKEIADLVLNCTSLSLVNKIPELDENVIGADTLCYDLAYGTGLTAFEKWARENGAISSDGIGMLVEQAAEAFKIWHGRDPETQQVIKRLRKIEE